MHTNLNRSQLIQAYLQADIFVLASQIECSPLVLFESMAASLAFITAPVGNAREIINWTNAGVLCQALTDIKGVTHSNPKSLAQQMAQLATDKNTRMALGVAGKKAISARFNWQCIAKEYETTFKKLHNKSQDSDPSTH